jgi:hypothetical protein
MGCDYISELQPLSLLFIPHMIYANGQRQWNDTDRDNRRSWRKTCPSDTLATTNPTWTDPYMNLGLCGERLMNNNLSHGTATEINN